MRRIHIMLYCVALLYKHRGRLVHVVASQTSFRVRFIVGCTQRTSHDPSTPLSSRRANTTACGASIKLCGGDATIVSVLSSRHTSIHSEPRILGYCSTGLLRRFRGAAIVSAIPAVQWSSDNWLHKVATGSHARASTCALQGFAPLDPFSGTSGLPCSVYFRELCRISAIGSGII